VVDRFHCGQDALDTWLAKYALQSHAAGSSRTRVVCKGGRVVGFYSLAAGRVGIEEPPARVTKGLGRHPVPLVVLTRLAVDHSVQGVGLGTALLRDAFLRVGEIADVVAVRALLVHAKDDEAKAWYLARARFAPAPTDQRQLYLLVKDLKATIASAN
jgi:GNAT superfamily N-acetyltransferase